MNTAGRCLFAIWTTCTTFAALAANELGTLTEAHKHHPAVFVSGNVLPYTVSGVEGYTYIGEAEQYFTGNQAESDSELYQEACLDAKGNLLRYLRKGRPACQVALSGAIVMYQYVEGKMRYVVCFVPKDSVVIKERKQEAKREEVAKVSIPKSDTANAPFSSKAESVPLLERMASLEKKVEGNPSDCLLHCRLARTQIRAGNEVAAAEQYQIVFKIVISKDEIDKIIASESLIEGAQFFENIGAYERALRFYRMVIRCNDMRHWGLSSEVALANKKISELLLK